jgi:hypothetical protein
VVFYEKQRAALKSWGWWSSISKELIKASATFANSSRRPIVEKLRMLDALRERTPRN